MPRSALDSAARRLVVSAALSSLAGAGAVDTGGRVERVDRFELRLDADTVEKVGDTGMVDVQGIATRTGVFLYDDPKMPGGVFREFRPADEVMNADSLATLRGAPFTIDHPTDEVTSANSHELTHGWVLDVQPVGDLVKVKIRIATDTAKAAIKAGTVELSSGYTAFIDETSGIAANGERYDAIQRDIRYNHLALVDLARAGPVARLHLDSFRVQRRDQAGTKARPMKNGKIRFDGKTYKAPAFVIAGLIAAAGEPRGDQIETGKVTFEVEGDEPTELVLPIGTINELLGMIGAGSAPAPATPAEGEPSPTEGAEPAGEASQGAAAAGAEETEEDRRADAKIAKQVKKAVDAAMTTRDSQERERGDVERRASKILDSGYVYKDSDTWQIMADAIKAVHPDQADDAKALAAKATKGDQRAAGRLDGLFDAAVKAARDAQDKSGELLGAIHDSAVKRGDRGEAEVDPIADARKERLDRIAKRSRGEDPDAAVQPLAAAGGASQ